MQEIATVSLSMIVKDEFEPVSKLIHDAIPYFDELCIVVSDKTTANKLSKEFTQYPRVYVKWREWNDHFDDARNASMAMVTSDYFFWLDADDEFDFRAVPKLVDLAEEHGIDSIFLPYNYAQDEQGNCITRHWRERLIRMGRGFEWRGWVHETCISDEKVVSHKVNQEVIHHPDASHIQESVSRNHLILEKAYAETNDPRYLHYLGMSYFSHHDYERAAKTLSEYLQVGGSLEDSYRSLAVISESAYHLNKPDIALEYATKCATMKPSYPMAYWLLAQYEADQKNWEEALEWVRVGMSKPDPETLSVFNPEDRTRAVLIAAQAEFMLGHYNLALGWLRKVENNSTAQSLMNDFVKEADLETFINTLPITRQFFSDDSALFYALTDDVRYDTRIKAFRYNIEKPTKWSDNSIVIFCGQGYEEWGPDTLDKGMGGSEEAVVYLSRELSGLGWDVTVFGETEMLDYEAVGAPVYWKPWKQIDTRDDFNVFISWRAPQYLERIKAKVKIADIHDVLPEEIMKDYPDVTYFVKSKFHRGLAPKLPDDKVRIIGNAIKESQFV